MIPWDDIACTVFACVTANHLGLVSAIEEACGRELPIVNCVKCSSFWAVLIYTAFATHAPLTSLAVSFLASYIALWLELLEGFIDTLYNEFYEKIFGPGGDDAGSAGSGRGYSAGSLP